MGEGGTGEVLTGGGGVAYAQHELIIAQIKLKSQQYKEQ